MLCEGISKNNNNVKFNIINFKSFFIRSFYHILSLCLLVCSLDCTNKFALISNVN